MFKRIRNAADHLARNRILQHILFWALSFLVLLNILKVSAEIKPIDLIYTAIFHIPIVLVTYLNLQILLPLFLAKRKFILYGSLAAVTITGGWFFYSFLFGSWIDFILPGYYFIAYYDFWDIALYLAIYLAATSLIKLARGWFRLQEMEKEKTLTELKALKSQVNPHFLFNSLNNIYGLSRKSSPILPDVILKLSGLLRYIIYETNTEMIGLQNEIDILNDYIALQRLRSPTDEKIEFTILGEPGEYKIAPLVFFPFIENSFKHGIKGGAKETFVKIKIEITGAVLNFEIENSKGKSIEPGIPEYKGIGIENVKKRLQLIYPNCHLLTISETESIFRVLLQVQLEKQPR
jgi:two-component system, LytTR family, sensor kinase